MDLQDEIVWVLIMTQTKMTMDRVVCLGWREAKQYDISCKMKTFWQMKNSLKFTVNFFFFQENVEIIIQEIISYLSAHSQQSNT